MKRRRIIGGCQASYWRPAPAWQYSSKYFLIIIMKLNWWVNTGEDKVCCDGDSLEGWDVWALPSSGDPGTVQWSGDKTLLYNYQVISYSVIILRITHCHSVTVSQPSKGAFLGVPLSRLRRGDTPSDRVMSPSLWSVTFHTQLSRGNR